MKNLILLLAIVLLSFSNLLGQDGRYMQAMASGLQSFGKAESPEALLASANTFQRIADQNEGDLWSNYYTALANIRYSFTLSDIAKRDALLDSVIDNLNSIMELHAGNSELQVLHGYALMSKMIVDPASRGAQYSAMVSQSFGKAVGLDNRNPRAIAMTARWNLGTAQFFGQEPTESCELANKSLELFKNQTPQGFEPSWGEEVANEVLAACSN